MPLSGLTPPGVLEQNFGGAGTEVPLILCLMAAPTNKYNGIMPEKFGLLTVKDVFSLLVPVIYRNQRGGAVVCCRDAPKLGLALALEIRNNEILEHQAKLCSW